MSGLQLVKMFQSSGFLECDGHCFIRPQFQTGIFFVYHSNKRSSSESEATTKTRYHCYCLPINILLSFIPWQCTKESFTKGICDDETLSVALDHINTRVITHYRTNREESDKFWNRDPSNFLDQNAIQNKICSICTQVVLNPVEMPFPCQGVHIFCVACWVNYLSSNANPDDISCPNCNAKVKVNEVKFSRYCIRELEQTKVKCMNVEEGCQTELIVGIDQRNLKKHLEEECQFEYQSCSKCNKRISHRKIQSHQEDDCYFKCEFCKEYILFSDQVTHYKHDKGPCVDSILCQCGSIHYNSTTVRSAHLSICPKESVVCIICDMSITRSEFDNHLLTDALNHCKKSIQKLEEFEKKFGKIKG